MIASDHCIGRLHHTGLRLLLAHLQWWETMFDTSTGACSVTAIAVISGPLSWRHGLVHVQWLLARVL